ncbi:hypothetical protein JRO89_XS02G0055900 [Xanthoceras sorbifolium]|uniref:Cytochrome P450 n=1 Tax=Xanthoceras sorbifolium TaxID=99658 RepID=A0ABQ8IFC6_9ROSI|nr:hypothetical protein JRO89_XS02G0055900 [Xanthoceras sorbifolium]
MADKYGKAFTIRLGIHRALVISSWEVTRECFTINDKVLSTRPESLVELLSNHRLEILQHVRDTEINIFIKELYAQCVKNGGVVAVEIKERFSHLSANVIVRMIADIVKDYISKMKRTARQLDYVLKNWVEEHGQRRLNRNVSDKKQDFIHGLILGGSDTTTGTLTWGLSLLLNNRHVLKKAQDELNLHVGKHRQVDESDIKNLIYLQAIVMETLRLYPAVPLSGPREAMEDCTIAGYHIPAGTRLVVNLWKLHRDPRIWLNPSEFVPERFLNEHANLDVRGLQFEFLPFGSGRRKCPGISLALQVLHLTLARLLHAFELGTVGDTTVDMSEGPGLNVPKATPLEVILSPRLPSMLFE